jgi:hypothetical protein
MTKKTLNTLQIATRVIPILYANILERKAVERNARPLKDAAAI